MFFCSYVFLLSCPAFAIQCYASSILLSTTAFVEKNKQAGISPTLLFFKDAVVGAYKKGTAPV